MDKMELISKEEFYIRYYDYDKIINKNKKVLKIKNIYKIIGEELDCKWLPKTEGWIVRSVEEVGDTYIFGLVNTHNGSWRQAEIQLRREKKFDPNDFMIKLHKRMNLYNNSLGINDDK